MERLNFMIVVSSSVFCALLSSVNAQNCAYIANRHGNGCGTEYSSAIPQAQLEIAGRDTRDIFKEDCDRHDICYQCANHQHREWNQKACDSAFLKNMLGTCNHDYRRVAPWTFNRRASCRNAAFMYYSVARAGGALRLQDVNSPEWCTDECANELGNPKNHNGHA